jgi:MFS family permease
VPRRLLPDHLLALLAIFLTAYATNVATPFLVLYRDRLQLGPTETQFIFVVYVAGILSTLLMSGPVSDRFGRKPVCVPFVVLSAIASALILIGRDSYPVLLAGRLLLGVSVGGVLSVGTAWVQELMGAEARVRSALLTTVATYAGFGLGPAISAILHLVAPAPLITPFILHVIAVTVTVPLLLTIRETHHVSSPRPRLRPDLGVPRGDRSLFWLAVAPAAIWVFAFPSTSFALFPVLLSAATGGNDVQVAGVAAMLTAFSGIIARPLLPRLGPSRSLSLGMAFGVVGYILGAMAFNTGAWPLLLPAAVCLGGGSGCISAGCLALLGFMAEDARRGALTATFYLLAYPSMSMPVVVTSLASIWTIRIALGAITVASVAGFVLVALGGRVMRAQHRSLLART